MPTDDQLQIKDIISRLVGTERKALTPDNLFEDEEEDFDKSKKALELEEFRQLIDLRKEYANKVFCFLIGWCVLVFAILAFHGWGVGEFALPESVLDFLVGATMANVIALVHTIVKGLFPPDLSSPGKK